LADATLLASETFGLRYQNQGSAVKEDQTYYYQQSFFYIQGADQMHKDFF